MRNNDKSWYIKCLLQRFLPMINSYNMKVLETFNNKKDNKFENLDSFTFFTKFCSYIYIYEGLRTKLNLDI